MGKSSRAKLEREEREFARQQKILEEKAKEKRLNRIGAIITSCAIALIILVTGAFFAVNSLLDNGYFLRKNISVTSENYKIDNSMLSYFLYEEYRNFVNENYSELDTMGLDAEKSLKKQKSHFDDGSWYDHFAKLASERMRKTVALCEMAKKQGITLSDAEKGEIDYLLEIYKNSAENSDYTELGYYEFMFGRGVTEKDIRACISMKLLANKLEDSLYDDFKVEAEQYNAEYKKAPEKYNSVEVIKYTFKFKENYKQLGKNPSRTAAMEAVYNDVIKDYAENYETELTKELVDMLIINNITSKYNYGTDKTIDSFAFSNSAKEGDCLLEKNQIYIIKSAPKKNNASTKNIRAIYVNNENYGGESYAQSFTSKRLDELKDCPDKTARFKTLSLVYSEDLASKQSYGEYRNYKKGTLGPSVDEWVFAKTRKVGDIDVIGTQEGQYILLFEGDGVEEWQTEIHKTAFDKYLSELTSQLSEEYNIEINQKNLYKINL